MEVNYINSYLQPAPELFLRKSTKSIFKGPDAFSGNKPIDGGYYLFTAEEMQSFLEQEPKAQKYFHPWYGAEELTSSKPRYCLWLGDCTPEEIERLPLCYERMTCVKEYRLNSKSDGTRQLANKPTRFHVECFPKEPSLIIPQTSTSSRQYLPLMFINPDTFGSNLVVIIPGANLFHFSILSSHLSMVWTQAVGNTLGQACRYTLNPVYSNFPWPWPPYTGIETHEYKQLSAKLLETGQAIIQARAAHPDMSLEYLYDPKTMPNDLRLAHEQNEEQVLSIYGLNTKASDDAIIKKLFDMHRLITKKL